MRTLGIFTKYKRVLFILFLAYLNDYIMKQTLIIALVLLTLPSLSSAAAIKLLTGDQINAEIIEQTGSYLKVKHNALGELTISLDNIIAIDGKSLSAEIMAISEAEKESKTNGFFSMNILSAWERSFTLGLNGKEGNTQELNFHTALETDYEDNHKRWDFGAYYNFSEKEGDKTRDDLRMNLTRDWLLPDSQWFYFITGQYDQDKFKSWDYRITGIVGAGYEFIETENFSLIGRTGLAAKKNYGSEDDDFEPELMIGLDTDWTISKVQSLIFKTEFFLPFEQADKFRNLSRLDWKFKLDTAMDLSFKLGLENEYETIVDNDEKHNDFRYRAALVWGI